MKKSDLDWEKSLTENDRANIELIDKMVEKSPELQKAVEGPIKWVGQKGFDECVSHLSGKKDITNPKSLCGWLKGQARKKGELSLAHMGSKEKLRYKKK